MSAWPKASVDLLCVRNRIFKIPAAAALASLSLWASSGTAFADPISLTSALPPATPGSLILPDAGTENDTKIVRRVELVPPATADVPGMIVVMGSVAAFKPLSPVLEPFTPENKIIFSSLITTTDPSTGLEQLDPKQLDPEHLPNPEISTLIYHITSGTLTINDQIIVAHGHSGLRNRHIDARDKPDMTRLSRRGPIPIGAYDIDLPKEHKKLHGEAMQLFPQSAAQMFRRFAVFIHEAGEAGTFGCIGFPREGLELVLDLRQRGFSKLQVVAF